MCTLLPRFPESKDCLQLLRVVLMGIEIATSISPKNASSRLEPYLSPRCIGAVLELYGPDKVDPLVLVACETSLRKQGMQCKLIHRILSFDELDMELSIIGCLS